MILLWIVLACRPPGPLPPASATEAVRTWAPPPRYVAFLRHTVAGPVELPPTPMRMIWGAPGTDGERLVYDVVTEEELEGQRRVVEIARHFYGPDGYGYLGTFDREGTYHAWSEPMIVLPPEPRVGMAWSGEHEKEGTVSRRSCEILASDLCDGGLVSVCDSEREDARIVLRDHFCAGVGWAGFEVLIQRPTQPTARMWSDVLHVDGEPVSLDPPGGGE